MSLAFIRITLVAAVACALTACGGGGSVSGAGGTSPLPSTHSEGSVPALIGRHFYVGTDNGKFETYDESNGSLLASLTLYNSPVSAITTVVIAPDGTKEYAIPTLPPNCSLPLQISVVNAAGTSTLGSIAFQGSIMHATISPDGTRLYALGQNGNGQIGVFVFDTTKLKLVQTVVLMQEKPPLYSHSGLSVTQDGSTLYVATPSNIYQIPTAALTASVFVANPIGDVTGFALGANDTKAFVSGLHDINVFDLKTATMLADIGVQPGQVPIFFSLVNSANEKSLVVDGDPPGAAYFSIVDQTVDTLSTAMLSQGGSGAASTVNQDGSLVMFYNGGPANNPDPVVDGVGASILPSGAQAYSLQIPDTPDAIAAQ